MGTYITVKIADSDKPLPARKAAAQKAFAEIERIEDLLSSFKEDSVISKINNSGTEEIFLDEEVFNILSRAKYFSEASSGAFDMTVMPLLELWGFHSKKYRVPAAEEIEAALKKVGSDKIVLDSRRRSIRFLAPGMKIDLGGIAKGYASDRAIGVLRNCGIHNALAACAGDIRVMGRKSAKEKWSIGIQDSRKRGMITDQLKLEDSSVSTSGSYERFFEAGGKRYSHIIDPRTGWPVDNDLLSVTIIAQDSVTSDTLATAVFVLGRAKGLELLEKFPSVQARVVSK